MPGRPRFQKQDSHCIGEVQREFPLETLRNSHYAGPKLLQRALLESHR